MAAYQDRLGTNRANGARFYPFGDEISSTSNDREKFATYTRDSYTGFDYADQRYYASAFGTNSSSAFYRFNTPDPKMNSANPNDPGTLNRYSYVAGDPINRRDPRGLAFVCAYAGDACDCNDDPFDAACGSPEGEAAIAFLACSPEPDPGSGVGTTSSVPSADCPSYTSGSGTFYTCFHQSETTGRRWQPPLKQIDKSLQKDPQCDKFLTSGGLTMARINYDLSNPASTLHLPVPSWRLIMGSSPHDQRCAESDADHYQFVRFPVG